MSGTGNSWSSFLSDLPRSESPVTISDEDVFHRQFKKLCATTRERDPERLLARFLRHHDQIMAFVSALDEATGLEANDPVCLGSIFWSKALEVSEKALRINQKDNLVREYLPKLSDVVPPFGAELPMFPENENVQKPLQQIFKEYMRCYDLMLLSLDLQQDTVTFDNFLAQTKSSTQSISGFKKEWEVLVKQAALDQAAAAKNMATQVDTVQSYYNTSSGPYMPQTTNVSFEWIEYLGKGSFGEVHKVREKSTGTYYAQKTIRPPDATLQPQVETDFLNEVSIMQRLRHHHIASVQFHIIGSETYSLFMLPAADYDLKEFLKQCAIDGFPGTELMHLTAWFGCLISALTFAHLKDIKHYDIKPGNILIKDHQAYLTDFGCAQDFSALDGSTSKEAFVTGTPVYYPPESHPRGRKGDVFSLGCVFSEMLTVRHKRTLHDFRATRQVLHLDNRYAFRENLAAVESWLNDIVPERDPVGMLLKDQTLLMLEPDVGRRREAREIKRGLRMESEMVFCNSCN